MNKQIIRIDASSLKWSYCMRLFYLSAVEGYKTPLSNNDTEFGSAFHAFKNTLTQTGDLVSSLVAAKEYYSRPMNVKKTKSYLTLSYLLSVCQDYVSHWENREEFETVKFNGKPLSELRFSIPYYTDDSVEIKLCGTIDDICKHKMGCYAIRDFKTTSVGDIDEYFAGYELSTQLMVYYMAVKFYAELYPDSIWSEICRTNFACFIDGVFTRGKDKPAEFKRSNMIFFSQEKVLEFNSMLTEKCKIISKMIQQIKDPNDLPPREGLLNGSCHTIFGPCKFFRVCAAPDEIAGRYILNNNFTQKEYNPLTHGL